MVDLVEDVGYKMWTAEDLGGKLCCDCKVADVGFSGKVAKNQDGAMIKDETIRN